MGFAVKNNRRWGTFYHQYLNILNKPGIQEFGFGTKLIWSTPSMICIRTLVLIFCLPQNLWANRNTLHLGLRCAKNFLNIPFKHLGTHTLSIDGAPSERFNFRTKFDLGKDLSVNEEVPEVGRLRTAFMTLSFQLNEKFTVNPSLRYSQLERLTGGGDYFNGSIARMNLRYQFSPAFNVRLIAEKNSFTNQFFIQPLIQWNPNPPLFSTWGEIKIQWSKLMTFSFSYSNSTAPNTFLSFNI